MNDDPFAYERAMGVDEALIQTWEEGIQQAQPLLPGWACGLISVCLCIILVTSFGLYVHRLNRRDHPLERKSL